MIQVEDHILRKKKYEFKIGVTNLILLLFAFVRLNIKKIQSKHLQFAV